MRTTPLQVQRASSPLGRIEVGSDGESIVSLFIEQAGRLPHEHLPESRLSVLDRAIEQLGEYFGGVRRSFDLPVALQGTPFQLEIWHQLQRLGFGEITSYGELGAATGRQHSGRPIGGAVGANPVPIIIGCHRVLAGDGRITGFSAGEGITTKAWLLDHEGIAHR
ncbi:methylated-DNA--[protein]-cysteine S-methyltransferase [Rathayibacter iranicus]|uniref:Methylated-DNA--[protein]-cysteine S-methyltransferase n=2 Tax=Rathayibacter iranicus TaxID=59737 RepID=A0AAD1ACJ6_9MICO|nr:methylated-DNA--[protein]-cysteine S-methyltransferase [Rathayibacter iranicus]AZZ55609.1 methylated-DNA--[protein]-cysteine S-methyltransferase [Rathayibacter iranicus]MWV31084.1 methylated-DNA--[protein]-cysteine S-methyltransferase [Rathayibacter iranicus NCPPB 2253 = VKM Ac-1602]PPI47879.1 methylated-DNA--[protein]-cysteine S-methyltransferase [Rathayibacter iranicus]PPI61031.1 methylated-DNA--[protein]-cysteine S-methyltransferase [Rathayibacter iranicus]PPI72993.1 methylated-DNA--[pro